MRDRGASGDERGVALPVHLRAVFIEALARRAALHDGASRRVLEERLAAWRANGDRGAPEAMDTGGRIESTTAPGPLAQLVAHIARRAPSVAAPNPPVNAGSEARADATSPATRAAAATPAPADMPRHPLDAPAELPDLEHFRRTWSRLSAARRLSRALAEAPSNAGPLNSQHLVFRTLAAMRELSPACLDHFMAHVDTLLWLDQATAAPARAEKEVRRVDGDRKGTRGRGA